MGEQVSTARTAMERRTFRMNPPTLGSTRLGSGPRGRKGRTAAGAAALAANWPPRMSRRLLDLRGKCMATLRLARWIVRFRTRMRILLNMIHRAIDNRVREDAT